MSSETSQTGRTGKLVVDDEQVARTTQWSVNPTLATKSEWGDSDSEGYTNRAAGRKDATFSTEGKYDTEDEQFDLFVPEDIVAVGLWLRSAAPNLYFAFPRAMCDDFSLMVDMDSQEVIGWTAGWGADGIYYRPGQAGAPVYTLPT